jgi:hypothetical protein
MSGWLGTAVGRVILAIVGIVTLWVGAEQLTAAGLLVMMTGLVMTVVAAVSGPALVTAPVARARRRV